MTKHCMITPLTTTMCALMLLVPALCSVNGKSSTNNKVSEVNTPLSTKSRDAFLVSKSTLPYDPEGWNRVHARN